MKATLLDEYTKNGKQVYRYVLTGTEAEVQQYIADKGTYYRPHTDGRPLLFSPDFAGKECKVYRTAKGDYKVDLSEFKAIANLANQVGGVVGAELAKEAINSLLGRRAPQEPTQNAPAPVPPVVQGTEPSDLGTI